MALPSLFITTTVIIIVIVVIGISSLHHLETRARYYRHARQIKRPTRVWPTASMIATIDKISIDS